MKKGVLGALLVLSLLTGGVVMATPAVTSVVVNATAAATASGAGPGPAAGRPAIDAIPPAVLRLYAEAAPTCPGFSWTVLAAIGTIESGNGTSRLPGVHAGHNPAGAEGPMQFEPATFAVFDEPVPPGGARPPSPYDMTDAVFAAVRMLCADGATRPGGLGPAIFDYNHSEAYVAQVLSMAQSYGFVADSGGAGLVALGYALAQVGTPYRWGGETPGVGFDCSGLTQAAYLSVGVALPRVAQDQYDAGPLLAPGAPLQAGDLVFFGSGPDDVQHVGLYVATEGGQDLMVDAPHTGAEVRVEPFPDTVGGAFGAEQFVGASRPAASG
jgi:cell wall-associated NlpC family hydrolase